MSTYSGIWAIFVKSMTLVLPQPLRAARLSESHFKNIGYLRVRNMNVKIILSVLIFILLSVVLRPFFGAWWNLVVEAMVFQTCELVTEVQFAAKEEDSDPVIRRIVEPSGSSFQGLNLTIEPLTDRIGNTV